MPNDLEMQPYSDSVDNSDTADGACALQATAAQAMRHVDTKSNNDSVRTLPASVEQNIRYYEPPTQIDRPTQNAPAGPEQMQHIAQQKQGADSNPDNRKAQGADSNPDNRKAQGAENRDGQTNTKDLPGAKDAEVAERPLPDDAPPAKPGDPRKAAQDLAADIVKKAAKAAAKEDFFKDPELHNKLQQAFEKAESAGQLKEFTKALDAALKEAARKAGTDVKNAYCTAQDNGDGTYHVHVGLNGQQKAFPTGESDSYRLLRKRLSEPEEKMEIH